MKKTVLLLILIALFFSPVSVDARTATDTVAVETTWVDKVVGWYDENMNYWSITALMTIESSFIPFPSEVVVPPAAALSVQEGSKLNFFLVIVFATIGALLGAIINYVLALWLGRPIIYKFADSRIGRLCLLSSEKIKKAEDYFNDHGKTSTFIGRLVPGIRQLISIPAGLARMPFHIFLIYTALGAGLWNIILAIIGYIVGDNMELITYYAHEIGYIILGLLGVAFVYLIARKVYRKKR